jgi:hypothetical protein
MSNKQRKPDIDADIPTEGPQDGNEVTIPPPAAVLAVQGTYLALDRLEGRAEAGEIIVLDDDLAAALLAQGRIATVDVTAPRSPILVSVEDEA